MLMKEAAAGCASLRKNALHLDPCIEWMKFRG